MWWGRPRPDTSIPVLYGLPDKPVLEEEGLGSPPPYKMIQTIGLSVGAAVAYIIAVLGLMFYCKKRCKAKRLQKQPEGEEPEMECLNGEARKRRLWVPSALLRPQQGEPRAMPGRRPRPSGAAFLLGASWTSCFVSLPPLPPQVPNLRAYPICLGACAALLALV